MSDAPKLSPSFVLDLSRLDGLVADLIRSALQERHMIAVSEGSTVRGIVMDVATYDDLVAQAALGVERSPDGAKITRLH